MLAFVAIATPDVLLHFCLTRRREEEGREKTDIWRCCGEEVQVLVQVVQGQCFWSICCEVCALVLHHAFLFFFSFSLCVCVCVCCVCMCVCFSLPDHIPKPVSGGPSSPHRVHFSSLKDCATCNSLGTTAHTIRDLSLKAGDTCIHQQTCSFPLSAAFFSSFRCGFNFWLFTVKLSRGEEVTWYCKTGKLRSNIVKNSLRLCSFSYNCGHLSLSLFSMFIWGFIWKAELCWVWCLWIQEMHKQIGTLRLTLFSASTHLLLIKWFLALWYGPWWIDNFLIVKMWCVWYLFF